MDLSDARVFLLGILVACPYGPNPKDCILHDMRKKSMKERLNFSQQLTENEVQYIIDIHKKCLSQKEGKIKTSG